MDRPRFQRPSRRLRPSLDGLERKALLSDMADPGMLMPVPSATEPAAITPTADPGGTYTPTSASLGDPGPVVPTLATTDPIALAASSGSTSIPADQIAIDGNIHGTLHRYRGATAGAEPAFVVKGKGRHATIGTARVDGLAMPSSIEALPSATLTLKTRKGNLSLTLQALPETSARPALAYRYTIDSGTGNYAGVTGSGTATLGLPRGLPKSASGGAPFTLLLQSDRFRT